MDRNSASEDAGWILHAYIDHSGQRRETTPETIAALKQALGTDEGDRRLPPVALYRLSDKALTVPSSNEVSRWRLVTDEGTEVSGEGGVSGGRLRIDVALPLGYHRLIVEFADGRVEDLLVLATPDRAFLPPAFEGGKRIWGINVQLFALRSARNWGIGDFSDLDALIERAAHIGADIIGVNPLHALFLDDPERASPYSPNSRQFLNVLYLDVEAMPDFSEYEPARRLRHSPEFDAELARLREATHVDYAGVAQCKLRMFRLLYDHFRATHLSAETDPRARDFRGYQRQY